MTERSAPAKEQALVLKTIRHGDTSRIATLFTSGKGKIAVLAKGARSGKSSAVGGSLDFPTLIEAVIHIKPSRSVQLLGQTSVVEAYWGLKSDVGKTAYAAVISELIIKGFTDDEPNTQAFGSALLAFDRLNNSQIPEKQIFIEFLLSLAEALGFGIEIVSCPLCGRTPARTGMLNKFLLDTGSICCVDCEDIGLESRRISGESAAVLRMLLRHGIDSTRIRITKQSQRELVNLMIAHLRFHHPTFQHLASYNLLEQLAGD